MAGIIMNAFDVLEATARAKTRRAPGPGMMSIQNREDSILEELQQTASAAFSRFGKAALISINLQEMNILGADLDVED